MKINMRINGDVHDISSRIREVDASYYIEFNGKTDKFELWGGRENGYILTLPFDRLDERTVEYARKTRIERLNKILEEIDRYNGELEAKSLKDAKRAVEERVKDL